MKINGMCPICYFGQKFKKPSKVTNIFTDKAYANGVALTPPMGWSSWNTFKNRISEDVILETAKAMKDKGLSSVGYKYVNLDDNWLSSMRDDNGDLQGDLTTFSRGIPSLVNDINALGLKVGIYSSNGTTTCEDLPASLYRERQDALTFARWGIEYFKYDFCHNITMSSYAPLVYSITVAKSGQNVGVDYDCTEAKLSGVARLMPSSKVPNGKYASGLDRNIGAMEYKVFVEDDGQYVLTVNIVKKGLYEKCLMAIVNGSDSYIYTVPPQMSWNDTARYQRKISLVKGFNTIKLFNPIASDADSAMLQYQHMGQMLVEASQKVAKETNSKIKPIVFSICEWGKNEPWKWGYTAGNLWRTTPDITPNWIRIMWIYNINVVLHKHAHVGCYNDPDMLEVGNGKLTNDENIAHFSLWCMMNSPLILGNDIRTISDEVLQIVANKNLIAINQDALCKQAKRIKNGAIDVLIKPLVNDEMAICIFNTTAGKTKFSESVAKIVADEYCNIKNVDGYKLTDLWSGETSNLGDKICGTLDSHAVKVFKIAK